MTAYDIYESVSAGFASPGEEQTRYSVDLERYIIEHPTSSLLVSVKGDSMIEAGIFPWDIAVVDKARTPKQGDVIIANIDYQYTIKYLQKDAAWRDYLEAANDNYMNIYPKQELQIFGVVVSIIRKY